MRPQIPHPNVGKLVKFNPTTHKKDEIEHYGTMLITGYEDIHYSRPFKQFMLPRYVLKVIEGKSKGGTFHCPVYRIAFV